MASLVAVVTMTLCLPIRINLLSVSGGYLRSCGHRDSELDLNKHLNWLVFSLPFRQNGDSSGAANVFRTQPLAIALQPSGESARPSTWSGRGYGSPGSLWWFRICRPSTAVHRFATAKGASTAQPSAAVAETGPQLLCIRPLLAVMVVRDGNITSFQPMADWWKGEFQCRLRPLIALMRAWSMKAKSLIWWKVSVRLGFWSLLISLSLRESYMDSMVAIDTQHISVWVGQRFRRISAMLTGLRSVFIWCDVLV